MSFVALLHFCTGRAVALPPVLVLTLVELLKFCIKVFYVTGEALAGQLSSMRTGLVLYILSSAAPCMPVFQYSILMYVTKQQPVTNVKITPAFVYTVSINFFY